MVGKTKPLLTCQTVLDPDRPALHVVRNEYSYFVFDPDHLIVFIGLGVDCARLLHNAGIVFVVQHENITWTGQTHARGGSSHRR